MHQNEEILALLTLTNPMKMKNIICFCIIAVGLMMGNNVSAQTMKADGTYDPDCVVEQFSDWSSYNKIIDINFSDQKTWKNTWQGETSRDCPAIDLTSEKRGGYVNAIIDVPTTSPNPSAGGEVKYPVLFYNATFSPKGTTAAFARQFMLGEDAAGKNKGFPNDWTVTGHKVMLEDNVVKDAKGYPTAGEAGFVQLCRDKAAGSSAVKVKENLGWMEIDHIPHVDRIQWSWSSTSAGRGIKCDYKVGDGKWEPLCWMGSEGIDGKYTAFSDQGYFIENEINADDVSFRWYVWDGERWITDGDRVQDPDRKVFNATTRNIMDWYQAPRVHKIKIYGASITAEQADFARNNMINNPGTLTDLSVFDSDDEDDPNAPDADAPVKFYVVAKDGTGYFTDVQSAVNAVKDGERGIIYIRKGEYNGQVFVGTKDNKKKFISFIGEDRDATILSHNAHMGDDAPGVTFDQTAPLLVYCDRFHAENLTFKNLWGKGGQALAVYTNGDAHTFTNCSLIGYQDTYKSNSGSRGYFKNCLVAGAVDFIYDSGTEWFEDCEIRNLAGGYVLAAGKADNTWMPALYPDLTKRTNIGLILNNCQLTAASGVANNSVYLGRTWDNNGGMIVMNSILGKHIKAEGWTGMGDTDVNTVTCAEYNNRYTDGAAHESTASWAYQLSEKEVSAYLNPSYIFKKAKKDVSFNYAKILAGHAAPTDFSLTDDKTVGNGGHFKWDAENPAPGYIVYKNGEFCEILTSPEFTVPDDGASYTVAAISNQGVVSEAVAFKETVKLTAFPTAMGFGKYASGGRGGKVAVVTNLDDDGDTGNSSAGGNIPGSLRWALKQYPGEPLTVVFNVSGWIKLHAPLKVKRDNLTIAGQTAPGEGITLYPRGFSINGSKNVIIRNIRSRCSSKGYNGDDVIKDASLVDQAFNAENAENVIVDHCTFGWSAEEVVNNQTSHYQTYSYCMVHEPLYDAGHHKGSARGFGAQWGGSQTTMHHNLMAHCNSRSPRFQGARDSDYIVYDEWMNNVNYNWGGWGACYGGENNQTGRYSGHEINFCNNYYQPGPATKDAVSASNAKYIRATAGSAVSNWFLSGNVYNGNATVTADNSKGFAIDGSSDKVKLMSEFIIPNNFFINYEFDWADFTIKEKIQSATDAFSDVVANVGCIVRDGIETRICNETKNGTASHGGSYRNNMANSGIIDDPSDLTDEMTVESNGYISYKFEKKDARSADYDTDNDGIADAWERTHGLTVGIDDHNYVNSEGYTALEVFCNSLMGEVMDASFTTGIKTMSQSQSQSQSLYNLAGQRVGAGYRGIVIKNGHKIVN